MRRVILGLAVVGITGCGSHLSAAGAQATHSLKAGITRSPVSTRVHVQVKTGPHGQLTVSVSGISRSNPQVTQLQHELTQLNQLLQQLNQP